MGSSASLDLAMAFEIVRFVDYSRVDGILRKYYLVLGRIGIVAELDLALIIAEDIS